MLLDLDQETIVLSVVYYMLGSFIHLSFLM